MNHPESAIVLCGGQSTRMGRDKASLPFGPETMAARVARIVSSVVQDVVLVGRDGQVLPPGARIARDREDGLGPLSGIAAGLHVSSAGYVFAVACDLPLLQPALVRRLLDLARGFEACVPVVDDRLVPTCAVYHQRVVAVADRLVLARQLRASSLADAVHARHVSEEELRGVDPELESFYDCNTQDRYAAALSRAGLSSVTP
jgi:molybdenum cofactor guanylyltransferase